MRITLATHAFASPGGSETYLLTVAEQLQRLGHEPTIFAAGLGTMSEFARERGIGVTSSTSALADGGDALIVQDAILAYQLADHFPRTPQLFRAASDVHDLQLPPALPGLVGAVVVCSERVRRRVRHLATRHAIHRLRQPVDTERFVPAAAPAATPRRAVLLGNYLRSERLELMVDALGRRGISCERVGVLGKSTCSPEEAIWNADIVVAKGRAALEGMSCGKAVFVYDHFGGDGWVTAERYPAMEADNFAGQSRGPISTAARLDEELDLYAPELGTVNRELATTHHGARRHAAELCGLLADVDAPQGLDGAPLRELARLVRLQWQTELRALSLEYRSRQASDEAERARAELHEARAEIERACGVHASETASLVEELERERAEHAASVAELERLRALSRTRRVELGLRLGTIADTARRTMARR
jgi:hypothetical protein